MRHIEASVITHGLYDMYKGEEPLRVPLRRTWVPAGKSFVILVGVR